MRLKVGAEFFTAGANEKSFLLNLEKRLLNPLETNLSKSIRDIRDGHRSGSGPATFFGSGFEFSGKTESGFGLYGTVYNPEPEFKIWRLTGFGVRFKVLCRVYT